VFMNQVQSIDSLYNPDACKSIYDKPEDSQFISTAKVISGIAKNSVRETTRNTSQGSSICDADEDTYFKKRYREIQQKERLTAKTRQPSPSFAVSNQNSSKKRRLSCSKGSHKLQTKIQDLKNLIQSEEQIISSLHKKVSHEKSALDFLQHQLEEDKQAKSKKKKLKQRGFNKSYSAVIRQDEENDDDILEQELNLGKTIHARSKARLVKMLGEISGSGDINNSHSIRLSDKKMPRHAQSTKASCSQFETLDKSYHRDHSSNKKKVRKNSVIKEEKDNNHDDEINLLKRYLKDLKKENLHLKENSTRVKNNDLLQVEQTKKMQHLIEVLAHKEKELVNHEKYYRDKIEDMGMKIMELNDQMETAIKYQDTIKSLAQEVKLKDLEIELTKKFFAEKMQNGFQTNPKRKHEWAFAHDALMKEVGALRGKLDSSYQNFPK